MAWNTDAGKNLSFVMCIHSAKNNYIKFFSAVYNIKN